MPKARTLKKSDAVEVPSDHFNESIVSKKVVQMRWKEERSLPLEVLESIVASLNCIETLLKVSKSSQVLQRLVYRDPLWQEYSSALLSFTRPFHRTRKQKRDGLQTATLSKVIHKFVKSSQENPHFKFTVSDVMRFFAFSNCNKCNKFSKNTKVFCYFGRRLCTKCFYKSSVRATQITEPIFHIKEPSYEIFQSTKFYLREDIIELAHRVLRSLERDDYSSRNRIHKQLWWVYNLD